jgi:hypothetical protein
MKVLVKDWKWHTKKQGTVERKWVDYLEFMKEQSEQHLNRKVHYFKAKIYS